MAIYKVEIDIPAETKDEAMMKAKCLTVFLKKFTTTEIKRFAEVVEKEPAKVAFAKSALGLNTY